ncbi:xylose isomerase [bacterium]|nr:xylose isomerase [bacterium]
MKTGPQLKQFAAFWTLTGQPVGKREWTVAEKIRRAQAAGFDAMGGRPDPALAAAVRAAGLEWVCYVDANGTNWEQRLRAAAATRPVRVDVQLGDHDTPPAVAARTWVKMMQVADRIGLPIDLEVHRDTCTETPEKTWEIAARYRQATRRKCRFCFDFSHFAIVKHLSPPYADRLLGQHVDLIQLARPVHFRPFNGHHCQVPATDRRGRATPEIRDYLEFVDAFFACWLRGARGGEVLYGCPEFGPRGGYGISTFPDVWQDAVWLRAAIDKLWRKNLAKWRR